MKQIFFLLLVLSLSRIGSYGQSKSWEYLSQYPPGDIPKVFAPGIVSTKGLEHSSPTFSKDLKQFFWTTIQLPIDENKKTIYTCKYEKGQWTLPQIASFSGKYSDDSPFYYNNKIYFSTNRNQDELSDSLNALHWTLRPVSNVWFSEYINSEWTEPKLFARPIELKTMFAQVSFSNYGNIIFLGHLKKVSQQCGIFYIKKNDEGYSEPQALTESINSKAQDWTPFIAPDESYIIFSSTRNQNRDDYGDLYICFKNSDETWSNPIYMGDDINTPSQERFPSVSPDGKYLFFTRWTRENNQDVFWVDAEIINKLKKKNKY